MSLLWQAGYVIAVILGLAYILVPKRVDRFGFEFLRHSSSNQFEESDAPIWLYRGLGMLFLFVGITGIL